ncbi:MAG: bifunctional riboflavin kinase/FAD synthetase [Ignavibacteriaceae bacterium]
MEIFYSLSEVTKDKNTVLTLGTFDGIHPGHQKIIEKVVAEAARSNSRSFLITFDPHPRTVVSNNGDIKLLNTLHEKIEIIKNLGIQNILVINFTKEFSQISSEEFVKKYIVDSIGVKEIVIGHNHHFGKGRGGDEQALREMGKEFGFLVSTVDAVLQNGVVVSSTKIRNALVSGDVKLANSFLNRFYSFSGTVVKGDKRGRLLGFPTANIDLDDKNKLLPALGIYAVEFILDGKKNFGVMSIGKRPTFYNEGIITTEVYILDFDEDIYGKYVTVNTVERIRGEEKFSSADELIKQMKKDTETGKEILSKLIN